MIWRPIITRKGADNSLQHVAAIGLRVAAKALSCFVWQRPSYSSHPFSLSNFHTEKPYLRRIMAFFTCELVQLASTTNSSDYFIYFRRQASISSDRQRFSTTNPPLTSISYNNMSSFLFIFLFWPWFLHLLVEFRLNKHHNSHHRHNKVVFRWSPPLVHQQLDFLPTYVFFMVNCSLMHVWCVYMNLLYEICIWIIYEMCYMNCKCYMKFVYACCYMKVLLARSKIRIGIYACIVCVWYIWFFRFLW